MGKRNLFAKTIVWACLAAGFPAAAQAQMFFEAEALLFGRNNQGKTEIVTGSETFSTETDFGGEAGFRLSGGWQLENFQVDASFSQINPWTSSSSGVFGNDVLLIGSTAAPGDASLAFDGLLSRASRVAAYDSNTDTYFAFALDPNLPTPFAGNNFESSARSNWRAGEINFGTAYYEKRWRIAGGYRYMQLDERNRAFVSGMFDDAGSNENIAAGDLLAAGAQLTGAGGDIVAGDIVHYGLSAETENQMHGFQMTFAMKVLERNRVSIEGFFKPGIYGNQISSKISEAVLVQHDPLTPNAGSSSYIREFESDKVKPAFGGNFGLKGVFALTDYIDIVGGGEVNVMSGVALSSNQFGGVNNTTQTYNLNNKGTMVNYGGTIGLRIFW